MIKKQIPKINIISYNSYNELSFLIDNKEYHIKEINPYHKEKVDYYIKKNWYGKAINYLKKFNPERRINEI